jgi:hypothetical protein
MKRLAAVLHAPEPYFTVAARTHVRMAAMGSASRIDFARSRSRIAAARLPILRSTRR